MTMNLIPAARDQKARDAFTLAEVLISVVIMVILVFLVGQMVSSTTAITQKSNKHIDTDTEARTVLDRMALDFAQMMKRTDIDYYVKAPAGYKKTNPHGKGVGKLQSGQQGNDQIAFFS